MPAIGQTEPGGQRVHSPPSRSSQFFDPGSLGASCADYACSQMEPYQDRCIVGSGTFPGGQMVATEVSIVSRTGYQEGMGSTRQSQSWGA